MSRNGPITPSAPPARSGLPQDPRLLDGEPTLDEGSRIEVPLPGDVDDVTLGDLDAETEGDTTVFLKQQGQIYMVRDWPTLHQWIRERRVAEHDLVSEGGVRWEPVGGRPELAALFEPEPVTEPVGRFSFEPASPQPEATDAASSWTDDDVDGIPTGLPQLPIGEVPEDATTQVVHTPQEPPRAPPPEADPAPLMAQVELLSRETPAPAPVPSPGKWEDLMVTQDDSEPDSDVPSWEPDDHHGRFQFEDDDDVLGYRRSSGGAWIAAAGLGLLGLAAAGLYLAPGLVSTLGGASAGLAATENAIVQRQPAQPEVPPPPAPDAPSKPAPEPATPASAETAKAEPPAKPAPAAPEADPPDAMGRLVDQGWSQVESDPAAARKAFQQVLDQDPSHDEANYGFGYSLLMESHPDASKYLCKARRASDPDVRQDVVGLIVTYSLSCP